MSETSELACSECGKAFDTPEAMAMHSSAKHPPIEKPKLVSDKDFGKIKRGLVLGLLLVVSLAVGYWYMSTPHYQDPPFKYTGQPHPETHPSSNFMDKPIPIPVQIHILEHAPKLPGALVQYNCRREEPDCAKLAEEIKRVVSSVDSQKIVYVAPYYEVDSLIVLTGSGKIEKLQSFDEQKIRAFLASVGVR